MFSLLQLNNLNENNAVFMKWSSKMRKVYKALRIMEVHKKTEPRFGRPLKPILPMLAWPSQNNGKNNELDDTIASDESKNFLNS